MVYLMKCTLYTLCINGKCGACISNQNVFNSQSLSYEKFVHIVYEIKCIQN